MQSLSARVGLVLGAIIGGLIVGLFPAEPRWVWSLIGGVTGGALGLGAAALSATRWPLLLRACAVLLLLTLGFGGLFLVVGQRFVTDPRNLRIGSPTQ